MPRTTVFGVYDGGTYGALERVADHLPVPPPHAPRQRLWRIVAKHAVLAAGATERSIVFGGNDRPGVMLASAMRAYVNRFAVAPGRRGRDLHQQRRGLGQRRRPRRAPAFRWLPSSTAAADVRRSPGRLDNVRVIAGGEVIATAGRSFLAVDHGSVPERQADDRGRCARRIRWLESQRAPDLPPGRTADLGREDRGVRPGIDAEGHDGRRRGERDDDACRLPRRRQPRRDGVRHEAGGPQGEPARAGKSR